MTSRDPYFSVVVPTYNRAALISKTINSVLSQTYVHFEVIVIDDGSTDETEAIVDQEFKNRVTFIRTENRERGVARNEGLRYAKGDYVYFLDSDDLLYPDHLEKACKYIQAQGNPTWFFQEYEFLDFKGRAKSIKYNKKNPIKDLVCKGNFMSCHGVFLRKDIACKYPFPEDREMAGSEDYALWLQLTARYPLLINAVVTSALVQHSQRSVYNFKPEQLLKRKQKMLDYVLSDKVVVNEFKPWLPGLVSNTHSYIALHTAMTGYKSISISQLIKAVKSRPTIVFSTRFLAIIKHLLLK